MSHCVPCCITSSQDIFVFDIFMFLTLSQMTTDCQLLSAAQLSQQLYSPPQSRPPIGQYRSRDLNAGLQLLNCPLTSRPLMSIQTGPSGKWQYCATKQPMLLGIKCCAKSLNFKGTVLRGTFSRAQNIPAPVTSPGQPGRATGTSRHSGSDLKWIW